MAYVNLPGTYPTLVDGNLRQFVANADPITLVIGTAASGMTGQLYSVNNVNAALVEFGRTSELGRGLVETRDGGSNNIFLMRLPGEAPSLSRVGSEHSAAAAGDNGFTVTPVLASSEAGSKYGIAYRHARNYAASGSGAADTHEVVGEICIVDLETQELVYYGDASGRSFEDLGLMEIDVDDTYDASSTSGPESFTIEFTSDDLAGPVVAGSLEFVIGGKTFTISVTGGQSEASQATALWTLLNADSDLSCFTFVDDTSGSITVTANGTVNAAGELVYPSTHPTRAGLLARPFLEGFTATDTDSTYTITAGTGHTATGDIGQFPANGLFPFNVTGGGTFVALEDAVADLQTLQDAMAGSGSTMTLQAAYTAGDEGQSCSLMEKYQKLHEAFFLLDFKDFNIVLPQGVTLNAPNVADGASIASLTDYPTPGSTLDALGELAIVENDDFTFTYYWDVDGDGIAEIASDGTIAGAAAVAGGLTYYEVNFAHQLAKFCYEASERFQFCHGVIGTTLPSSLSPRGIRNFFGRLPTYTFDAGLETDVVASASDNGSGILGHKLVGGQFGYHFNIKNGGIPLREGGNFAVGAIVTDENGEEVDLGLYIDGVAAFGHLRNEYDNRTNGYLTNLANVYGGLISATPVNENTTAKRLPAVQMNYYMPAKLADAAAGARLVTIVDEGGSATVADGPTMALLTSDYTRLSTVRIVAKIVEEFRLASRPFLGKGQSTSRRLSHETALQGVLQANISEDETITAGTFTISQTRAQRIEGKMDLRLSITPVFELRQINLIVSLSA